MIEHPQYFIWMIVIFIALSFLSSAMESAFSGASLSDSLGEVETDQKRKRASLYEPIDKIVQQSGTLASLNDDEKQQLKKAQKFDSALERKLKSWSKNERAIFVGTFASLSVFLNTALTAFLSYAFFKAYTTDAIPFYYPAETKWEDNKFIFIFSNIDLGGSKSLVFVASSLPILIFGKIIPKEVGARYDVFFAHHLNSVAIICVRIIGWLPSSLLWPINKVSDKR